MSIFPWRTAAPSGPAPQLDDLIRDGEAKRGELEARVPSLALDVAEGVEGAADRYAAAKGELEKLRADLDLLLQAREEHQAREARRLLQARQKAHVEKVQAITADLSASVKQADEFTLRLGQLMVAFDALMAARTSARAHALTLPSYSDAHVADVRRLVACELWRLGARLSNVGMNTGGLPNPECDDGRLTGNLAGITPLADRLRTANTATLAALDRAAPQ